MKDIITDREIAALIKERKIIPDSSPKFTKRENRGSNEHILNITGEEGNKY